MNFVVKFFHEFMHPHCEHCEQDNPWVKTTELLRSLLESEKYEKKQLLDSILQELHPTKEVTSATPTEAPKEIRKMAIPWKVRQQQLEADDRKKAAIMREKEEELKKHPSNEPAAKELSVEELEKELGVVDAS